jgi:hypothetical protein
MKESSFRNIRKEPFEKNQHKKSETFAFQTLLNSLKKDGAFSLVNF